MFLTKLKVTFTVLLLGGFLLFVRLEPMFAKVT